MPAHEVNFDGIVGPTHNYAGLSFGNLASTKHKLTVSSPRQAALQGLAKMKFLFDLGVKQAVLPPQERPHLPTLRKLGFSGSDAQILEDAARNDPMLLASVCSSSSMWTANAATVSPSADTADGRVHFTPANLITQFHRSIEPPATTCILRAIFADAACFAVHDPLPAAAHFSDEGAANHMRLCPSHGEPGVEVFVFGRRAFDSADVGPRRFPARQTYEACSAIARSHLLAAERVLFVQQNPAAIDAGAFHNDVVGVANQHVLLHHESAYATALPALEGITCVPAGRITLEQAVESYIFNSQLVTLVDGSTSLVAPTECLRFPTAQEYVESLHEKEIINSVHYVDVRQSMQNGGGPACLRLRVVLTDDQVSRMRGGVMFSDALHRALVLWVQKHYRDSLLVDDLRDPALLDESRRALDELCGILHLPTIYEFQLP